MKKFLIPFCMICSMTAGAQDAVTISQIISAENMFALHFTTGKRDSMASGLTHNIKTYEYLHAQNLNNDVPLPLWYSPLLPGMTVPRKQLPVSFKLPEQRYLPADRNQLAFYSIPQLASLIKNRKISSEQLTRFYIEPAKKIWSRFALCD